MYFQYQLIFFFQYDFMHATPPMGSLTFMKGQPITDEAGWVDVDKETTQHKKYRKKEPHLGSISCGR